MDNISIGVRVKQVRKDNKLTQQQFADKLCVSRSFVSNIERDADNASNSLIRLISLTFNIDENWIKFGS